MNIKKILTAVAVAVLSCAFVACGSDRENSDGNEDKKVVIATTFPAYDWARNIAGSSDGIEVRYLVNSNVDLHSYQPSAADLIEYKEADLVICIGGESEEWTHDAGIDESKLLSLIDVVDAKEEERVEGMEGEEEEEESKECEEEVEYDEHIWLSLKNAGACSDAIEKKFSDIDPKNAQVYELNLKKYVTDLKALDEKYEDAVSNAKCNTLIFGDRFPFRYLASDYGLNYYAAFIGCSAETEASFETIVFLANKVDELKVPAICTIGNRSIAETIAENSNLSSDDIVEFESLQDVSNKDSDASYLGAMERNLESLKKALGN